MGPHWSRVLHEGSSTTAPYIHAVDLHTEDPIYNIAQDKPKFSHKYNSVYVSSGRYDFWLLYKGVFTPANIGRKKVFFFFGHVTLTINERTAPSKERNTHSLSLLSSLRPCVRYTGVDPTDRWSQPLSVTLLRGRFRSLFKDHFGR